VVAPSIRSPARRCISGGLYWTQTPRGEYEVQRVWHPNVVAQQVQQTNYVPQTVAQQVPMQVCRYVPNR